MLIASRVFGVGIMMGLMSPIVHTTFDGVLDIDPDENRSSYLFTLLITAALADQWARDNS